MGRAVSALGPGPAAPGRRWSKRVTAAGGRAMTATGRSSLGNFAFVVKPVGVRVALSAKREGQQGG